MSIYAIKLNFETISEVLNKYSIYITKNKRSRLSRLRKSEDRLRLLVGDMLIQYLVYSKIKVPLEDLKLVYNTYGKPYLFHSNWYFNISHSGEWVVGSISQDEIGIDIEQIRALDIDITYDICTDMEYKRLISKSSEEQIESIYDLWTIKESYTKALGRGLFIPLKDIIINEKNCEVTLINNSSQKRYFYRIKHIPEYKLCLCTTTLDSKIELKKISQEALLSSIDSIYGKKD